MGKTQFRIHCIQNNHIFSIFLKILDKNKKSIFVPDLGGYNQIYHCHYAVQFSFVSKKIFCKKLFKFRTELNPTSSL